VVHELRRNPYSGGGNHPKAANKETVSGPLNAGGPFAVRNGQTTGSITVGPLGAGDFSCPNGQTLVLASVSYSNITLSGEAGSVDLGSLSATLVDI
jgi:hypothetical protein